MGGGLPVLWPNGSATKPYVTSAFGPRNIPIAGASKNHKGTDMVGFSTIRAIADGVVHVVGTPGGWVGGGVQVWVQHAGFFTRSLHMRSGSTRVRVGDRVSAGDALGTMGQTGTATDDHLHFEVTPGELHYWNTGQVDPVAFIKLRLASTAGGITPEEDDMSAEAERQIKSIYDAIFSGGNSMRDGKKSISQSLADIAGDASAAAENTKPINRTNGPVSLRQEIADTKGIVLQLQASQAGLEAALETLARAKGLDAGAILKAAQTGVENALRKVTFSADVDG